jgi:DNA-binding NarL/FixJ family response regulator
MRRSAVPRLAICDDERLVADALRQTLEPEFHVVGVVPSGPDLMALLQGTRVECVLLEVGLTRPSGLELLKQLHSLHPQPKVLVLTLYQDRIIAESCLRAGACGFVPKRAPFEELQDALRQVLAGGRYLSPRVPKTSHGVGMEAEHLALRGLTRREQAIVRLMGDGLKPAEVARRLRIRRNTVAFHIEHIKRKLGCSSTREVLRYAILVAACIEDAQSPGPPEEGSPGGPSPHANPD